MPRIMASVRQRAKALFSLSLSTLYVPIYTHERHIGEFYLLPHVMAANVNFSPQIDGMTLRPVPSLKPPRTPVIIDSVHRRGEPLAFLHSLFPPHSSIDNLLYFPTTKCVAQHWMETFACTSNYNYSRILFPEIFNYSLSWRSNSI